MIKNILLASLKKLNMARSEETKLKLAKANGFTSIVGYRDYLLTELGEDAPNSEKPSTTSETKVIRNVHILDISTSMRGAKLSRALEGINMEMDGLKKVDEDIEYLQTIVTFGNSNSQHYLIDNVPIKDTRDIDCHVYGCTALYETIGKVLTTLKENITPNVKTLVKIFTDGEENSSRGPFARKETVAKLISICEELGFTITFVGTKQDVDRVVKNLNVDITNTMSHDNTSRGVAAAYGQTMSSTIEYSKKVVAGKPVRKGFYKKLK